MRDDHAAIKVPRRTAIVRAFSGAAIALAIAECIARQWTLQSVAYEPEVGFVTREGTVRWGAEGHATSHWLAHGVRRSVPVPSSNPKILALGDSFTEALMVSDGEVFTDRAEADLGIPIINLGRSGGNIPEYILRKKHDDALWSADWRVVALSSEDLVADAWNPTRTHFVEDSGGDLQIVPVLLPPPGRAGQFLSALRAKSGLISFGYVRRNELRNAWAREPRLFFAASPAHEAKPPSRPIEKMLEQLVERYEGKLTLLYLPLFDSGNVNSPGDEAETRFWNACNQHTWSCASPRPYWGELKAAGKSPYGFSNSRYNQGHMNADGHALTARALVAELNRLRRDALF